MTCTTAMKVQLMPRLITSENPSTGGLDGSGPACLISTTGLDDPLEG